MGYYTKYRLEWTGEKSEAKPCPNCAGTGVVGTADPVGKFIATEPIAFGGTQPIAHELQDQTKWYEHEADMRTVSQKFPDVVFTLRGEGEEAGDVWVKYFRNGQMQTERLKTELPGFGPKKLR